MTLADRVLILNKGAVEQVGTPQEIYQHPATLFVAGFIGNYPMNFLAAKIDWLSNTLLTEIGMQLPLPPLKNAGELGDNVVVGIRPEHMLITTVDTVGSVAAHIDYIDDMGADKLVQVITRIGKKSLLVRVFDHLQLVDNRLGIDIILPKATLFCRDTGRRLGGWND